MAFQPVPSQTDDAAFPVATGTVAPLGALVCDVNPDEADEGDVGIPRMSAKRVLYVETRGRDGRPAIESVDVEDALNDILLELRAMRLIMAVAYGVDVSPEDFA